MPGPLGDDHRCSGDHVEGIDGPGRSIDWLDVEGFSRNSRCDRISYRSVSRSQKGLRGRRADAEIVNRVRRVRPLRPDQDVSAPSGLSAATILMLLQIRSMVWFSPVKPRNLYRSLKRKTRQRLWAAAVENSSDPVWCGTVLFETSLPEYATTLGFFFEIAILRHHTLTISKFSVPASSLTQDLLV